MRNYIAARLPYYSIYISQIFDTFFSPRSLTAAVPLAPPLNGINLNLQNPLSKILPSYLQRDLTYPAMHDQGLLVGEALIF